MIHVLVKIKKYTLISLLLICMVLLSLSGLGMPACAGRDVVAGQSPGAVLLPRPDEGREISWSGAAGDGAWSNPGNWEGGRVPGPGDTACLVSPAPDARVDAAFGGVVAGLVLGADYAGTLRLERSLRVQGDLEMAGSTLQGGDEGLDVDGAVRVSGGLLVTPAGADMNVFTMDIAAPGVVRLGANGKLNLSGGGQPLTGNGLLDTTTYRPNSVEYTGAATADLGAAAPATVLPEFSRADALALDSGENNLYAAVIDPAGAYAYFGTYTSPGIIVKVNLVTFTRVGALTLNSGENNLSSAVIDPAGAYAYFGTYTSPGIVVKVNLASFTRVGALTLNSGENNLHAAVIDPAGAYAYFGTFTRPGAHVVKVELATLTRVDALTLSNPEDPLWTAVMDPAGEYAYFATGLNPGIVIQVGLDPFTRTAALALNPEENYLYSAAIDPAGEYAYFGTQMANPGIVVQVGLDPFTRTAALTLEAEVQLGCAVIDPAGEYAYFGVEQSPGIVVQVNLANFTRAAALTLNAGENNLRIAAIDPAGEYAYFGTLTSPGIVVKIELEGGGTAKVYLPVVIRSVP